MKRRSFLTTATLASAGISTLLISGCNSTAGNKDKDNFAENNNDVFELDEETIYSLQEKLTSGLYTSKKLVELYLKRIEAIDQNGALLKSVIEINPDAVAIAIAMDNEIKSGKKRGLLHGIPVMIKDNIDTADKMQTTAGSLALVGNIAANDAFIVTKLR
jgi:amidase